MLSSQEILSILRKELPYLNATFNVKRIGLFGSYAKDIPKLNSDIDLIVEFEKPIGLAFMDLADYIEKLFNKKVDILTPEGIRNIRVEKIAQDIKESIVYV